MTAAAAIGVMTAPWRLAFSGIYRRSGGWRASRRLGAVPCLLPLRAAAVYILSASVAWQQRRRQKNDVKTK